MEKEWLQFWNNFIAWAFVFASVLTIGCTIVNTTALHENTRRIEVACGAGASSCTNAIDAARGGN